MAIACVNRRETQANGVISRLLPRALERAVRVSQDGRFAAISKKERNDEMQRRIYRFVQGLPVAQGAKAGIRIDVQGQLNSYIELRDSQEGAQMPTAGRLNEQAVAFDAALAELATLGLNLEHENALRDEIARLARSPRVRRQSLR